MGGGRTEHGAPGAAVRVSGGARCLYGGVATGIGAAATVVLEAIADGASAAQLPELELDTGNDAQVFPEPAQVDVEMAVAALHAAESRIVRGQWQRAWTAARAWLRKEVGRELEIEGGAP